MTNNFFRLFIRNFAQFGILNSVNIVGLSLGFTAALMIILYVDHELSFDDFHYQTNKTYRFEYKTIGDDSWSANPGNEHAQELLSGAYPEVDKLVRYNYRSKGFVTVDNGKFVEDKAYQTTVNSQFFDLFDFKFIEGDKESVFSNPNEVVLTESIAKKYFGDNIALGEIIDYDSTLLTVSGVVENLPTHTHLDFNMLLSNAELYTRDHFHTQTYIQLVSQEAKKQLESKILAMNVAHDEYHELSEVRLLPIFEIHLSSDIDFGNGGRGDTLQVQVFIVLAVLILFIAVINYVNLTFAIFLNKGKEIGVRKVLGEGKMQVIAHLARQAIATTLLSVPLIVLFLYLFLPAFSEFMGVNLNNILWAEPAYAIGSIALLIGIALLTIVYPLFALGQTDTASLIKSGLLLTPSGGVRYRNVLILVQFIFLFTLGLSAWFMNQQIQYLDNKDKGFNAENVIKVQNAYEIGEYDNFIQFKNSLKSYSSILGVSFGPMMGDGMSPLAYKTEGSEEVHENLLSYGVDIDYFDVMGIDIPVGDFKRVLNSAADGHIVSLVNQSFINLYNWSDDPIGRKIILRPGTENELHRQVSAVFRDFHFFSFKEKITPQIISLRPDPRFVNTNILIKFQDGKLKETREIVEKEWGKIQPTLPIDMTMMQDAVQKMYEKERQTGLIGVSLSALAILLSVMGIVGFMFYLLGLKSREMAIRKVLGASLAQIVYLLNTQLFYVILIAGLFGSIGSYWLISTWLEGYAYAIDIPISTFIIVISAVYLLVFTIIAIQTIRSSQINPASVLKEK